MTKIIFALAIIIIYQNAYYQYVSWRGENSSGKFDETGLLTEWPEEGPQKVLSVDGIGLGWGSPITVNNIIYVAGKKDSIDFLSAISMNGELL